MKKFNKVIFRCPYFCSHPPVVTLGRGTKPGDVAGWTGALIDVSRGGRATYHGPGQLVIYPIINLSLEYSGLRKGDVHSFLRLLEHTTVTALAELKINAFGRSLQDKGAHSESAGEATGEAKGEAMLEEATGVWVGDRKIASLGIAIKSQ